MGKGAGSAPLPLSNKKRSESIVLRMGFEDQRHDERKDHGGGNARACRGKRAGKRLKQTLLRAAHRAVGKQISESGNGNRRARARKFDKRLIKPQRRKHDPRQHKGDENFSRREVGEIDDHLRNRTDQPADRKRFYKQSQYFEVFHNMYPPKRITVPARRRAQCTEYFRPVPKRPLKATRPSRRREFF